MRNSNMRIYRPYALYAFDKALVTHWCASTGHDSIRQYLYTILLSMPIMSLMYCMLASEVSGGLESMRLRKHVMLLPAFEKRISGSYTHGCTHRYAWLHIYEEAHDVMMT